MLQAWRRTPSELVAVLLEPWDNVDVLVDFAKTAHGDRASGTLPTREDAAAKGALL